MPHDDWLYEMAVANNECLVLIAIVGSEELNRIMESVQKTANLRTVAIRCIESELNHFLHGCYAMNAVIED